MSSLKRIILAIAILLTATICGMAQQWALPIVSVTSLRGEPRHGAEQVSQVVMGTPLKITLRQGDWWKVETPEGYSGFIRKNTLKGLTDSEMNRWRSASRTVIDTDRTEYVLATPAPGAARVCDIVGGSILELSGDKNGGYSAVILPDGRRGYLPDSVLTPIEEWVGQVFTPEEMPVYAARMTGAPYVWGGTSSKGMDCSGLTQICAYRQGVMLPRDASQQIKKLSSVDKSDFSRFLPGDLLFFGNTRTGRINHVAIWIGDGRYIHSSGRVRVSSLDPADALYENPGLIAVGRITPSIASNLALKSHPFYF